MNTKMEKKIDEIISKMTLKEKIGQLNQLHGPKTEADIPEIMEKIRNGEVGSIILAESATAGNDKQGHVNVELCNELQRAAVEESRLGIPMIYGRDVIHGHRTVYPVPLASACSFNTELTEKCYRDIAEEAAADSIHWTFSPMIDICRDPRWGRIIEGPGEDPYLGACMAKACVKGFQGDDVADKRSIVSCAKHYLGYGFSEGGRDYHRTEISDYTLYNSVLPAFRGAVDAGALTVMSSFNDINGIPVSGSKKYLTDILRGKLGFEGFVISDWTAVEQLEKQGVAESRAECAEMALKAGLDMDMNDLCYIENLESLVNEGDVSVKEIDLAVRRILRVKLTCGLFENPYCEKIEYDRAAHIKNSRELAAESMLLLKNENNILPINKKTNVALIGPYVNERRSLLGSWVVDGEEDETPNFSECLKKIVGDNLFVSDSSEFTDDIQKGIADADVVILALGENWRTTGEAFSVSDISLYADQCELAKRVKESGKKTIGVIFCGRPRALENVIDNLDGLVYAWHSGSETANAVCDILFGDTVPSGKAAVTFPRKSGHIPLYYNVTESGRFVDCYYDKSAKWSYVDGKASPLFPFGFGLSYTTFKYSKPESDKESISLESLKSGESFKISVDVKNDGMYDGKETVQLYIRDLKASVMRPMRELKDFKKVLIKRGQTENVTFELDYGKLGFYLENGDYVVEKGEFDIFVGENSLTKNKITVKVTK